MKAEALFHIGDLSKRTGVPARTIRYYEAMGLLRRPLRNRHGYRLYASDAADRLRFIRTARGAGFSLKEIREILNMADEGKTPCRSVLQRVRHRSEDLDRQIAEMIAMKSKLEGLLKQWTTDLPRPTQKEICPLIESLKQEGGREHGNQKEN
ncbi:MAG: heavy metal-responsive transcriptional regulator [Candidatus Manganitrophaceae bacterium]|nr:MAG: heavy metal-responsive transcriptional regulator [Candidatus Manganitrophaceae bacterium]